MKDITFNGTQLEMIVRISMLFNQEPDTYSCGVVFWLLKNKGELYLDFNQNEVKMVDFFGSPLEYCCVQGITKGMEVGDYYTEKY